MERPRLLDLTANIIPFVSHTDHGAPWTLCVRKGSDEYLEDVVWRLDDIRGGELQDDLASLLEMVPSPGILAAVAVR